MGRNCDNSFLDDQHFYLSNSLEQSFINLEGEKKNHIIVQDLSQKPKDPARKKEHSQAPGLAQDFNPVPKLPLPTFNSRVINSSPINTTHLTSQEDYCDSLSNIEYDKIEQESLEIEKRITMLKRKGREIYKGMREQQ